MSLKYKRFPKAAVSLVVAGFALSACEGDFSLGKLGDAIDPPPRSGTAASDDRPKADENGVITYPNYQVAVAKSRDTVSTLADRVGISADSLASYNGLKTNTLLRDGQILAIPQGAVLSSTGSIEDIASEALDNSSDSSAPTVQTGEEPVRHTVRQGETAYSIARLYNVSVTALASWNGLDRDLSVRNGQRLLVPTGSQPFEEPESKPASGTAAVTPNPPSSTKPLPKPEVAKPVATPKEEVKPAPKPAPAPTPSVTKLVKPVSGKVIRAFSKKSGGNEGIDYGAPVGTTVKAAATGTVALISKSVGDTTIVLLRHPNNLYTVYSNVTNVSLKKGNKVSSGSPIGIVAGGTPPYVHFEVRKGTEAVDPTPYF